MDVIYIGLPFVFWQEDESKHGLDIHVTEGFQKIGFHVYPLNAGDNAEEICAAYNDGRIYFGTCLMGRFPLAVYFGSGGDVRR